MEAKPRRAVFVGDPEGTKGYKLYEPDSRSFVRSRDVVFLETKFHDFGNEHSTKSCFDYPPEDDDQAEVHDVPVVDERDDKHDEQQGEPEIPVEIQEPINDNQPVGVTYEDHFMRGVEEIGTKRQRKPAARYDEECYIANDLTAEILLIGRKQQIRNMNHS